MNALECLRAAVRLATLGSETAVQLREPAGPHLERLADEGMLRAAIPLFERGGTRSRILMLPRRRRGPPTITEILSADHARLDGLLESLEAQAQADDLGVVGTARRFIWAMQRHMKIEDELVFPLYERTSGMSLEKHVRPFHIEHACIEHYLALLRMTIDSIPRSRARAMSDMVHIHCGLSSVLREHDAREERTLLPTLDHTVAFVERPEILKCVVAFDPDLQSSLRIRSRASADMR